MKVQDPRTPAPEPAASDPADTTADTAPGATASLPVRAILVTVGTLSLGVGLVGIVVPVLPTTPFLLLAAACYARASDRLYSWLIGQPSLGPIITEWRRSRSLPPGVKARALVVIALSFGASIILVDDLLIRGILLAAALAVGVFVYRIPTRS